MHSELRIGDSIFSRQRPVRGLRARPRRPRTQPLSGSILIYTEDVDALYDRAIAAGATELNRAVATSSTATAPGSLRDPYGHRWMLATHTEDMSEEEMQRRTEEAMAGSR